MCALILVLSGFASCAGAPKNGEPRFTQRHYTYSVLLVPERLGNSPQLDVAFSLLRMDYPEELAPALHETLYGEIGLDAYKDFVLSEQRKNYRNRAADMPAGGGNTANFNWRYAERFSVKHIFERGLVIERDLETYYGGANAGIITRYYNIEFGVDGFRQVSFDDLFDDYQDDQRLREIVYNELREYSNLDSNQPLSRGIYYSNEPEMTFNFFITEEGLGLHWDPAQIAPYSHGRIQIILPWYSLSSMILYEGIQMLSHKFGIHIFE